MQNIKIPIGTQKYQDTFLRGKVFYFLIFIKDLGKEFHIARPLHFIYFKIYYSIDNLPCWRYYYNICPHKWARVK